MLKSVELRRGLTTCTETLLHSSSSSGGMPSGEHIAVSTTERHLERSCARNHAELRPRLVGCRSDSMVRSQVRRGRRQSVGRRLMAAWRAREWSCDGSARVICPNRRNRLDTMVEVTGGCPVLRLTSSFVSWAVYGMAWFHLGSTWVGHA